LFKPNEKSAVPAAAGAGSAVGFPAVMLKPPELAGVAIPAPAGLSPDRLELNPPPVVVADSAAALAAKLNPPLASDEPAGSVPEKPKPEPLAGCCGFASEPDVPAGAAGDAFVVTLPFLLPELSEPKVCSMRLRCAS